MKLDLSPDFSLPVDAATQTFLIVGKRGSGKSNTAVRLAEQLYHARVPFVAIDPVDCWHGLKTSRDGQKPGLGVYVFGGARADLPLEATAGALIADTIIEHRLSAVLSVKHLSGRERSRFVSDLTERLFQKNKEPLHLFLEEAHEVCPQNPYKGEEEMVGRVSRIWKLGRSSGLGGSAITQRPASLSKNITTQAEILVVHRTLGPQDVAAIREWIKYHGEREDILAQLSTLKTGEAFIWAPDFPEGRPIGLKRVTMLQRETFDSAATPKAGEKRIEPKALAQVDLEALRAKMAATIEKAKADDPRELKRQVAELQKQLAAKPSAAPPKVERVEVPVIKPEQIASLNAAAEKLSESRRASDAANLALGSQLAALFESLRVATQPRAVQAVAQRGNGATPTTKLIRTPVSTAATGSSDIGSGGLRRILIALAQRGGLTNRQIGVRATLSSKSGTFSTYLSKARSSGWVRDEGDRRFITDDGLAALGNYQELPTGQALLDHWLGELGSSGAGRILRAVADAYPRGLTNAEAGEKANISHVSGTFSTYLSKLRTLELIEGRGELRASEELFS